MKKLLFFLLLSLPLFIPLQANAYLEPEEEKGAENHTHNSVAENSEKHALEAGKKLQQANALQVSNMVEEVGTNDLKTELPIPERKTLCEFLYEQFCFLKRLVFSFFSYFQGATPQGQHYNSATHLTQNISNTIDSPKTPIPKPNSERSIAVSPSDLSHTTEQNPEMATEKKSDNELDSSCFTALQAAKALSFCVGPIKIDSAPAINRFLANESLTSDSSTSLQTELESLRNLNQTSRDTKGAIADFQDPINFLTPLLDPLLENSEDGYDFPDMALIPSMLVLSPEKGKGVEDLTITIINKMITEGSFSQIILPSVFVAVIDRTGSDKEISLLTESITLTSKGDNTNYVPRAIIFSDNTETSTTNKNNKYSIVVRTKNGTWELYKNTNLTPCSVDKAFVLSLGKTCCIIVYAHIVTGSPCLKDNDSWEDDMF